ncbi:MAG: site-specific DNA-methyltransferase [Terracidiphilus sp.]
MRALGAGLERLSLDYAHSKIGNSLTIHADCLEWLGRIPPCSIHGIVTDPPYGVKEYEFDQIEKRANGNGGIWRIPPSFDGSVRQPLPRFTALNEREREQLCGFFEEWAKVAAHALVPGAHVFLACNSFLAQLVYSSVVRGGLEFRGQVIRIVRTLRGGDRPKNAETEFPGVCSLPRGGYEPWGIFRRPLEVGMKVSDCLRKFGTGGLRRRPDGLPFSDLIDCGRTPQLERGIANHPSLKPQTLLRELVWAVLPLGEGLVCDPFMGSGSTIAAAEAIGYQSIGVEKHESYYKLASKAIKPLSTTWVEQDQINLVFAD